MAGDDIHQLWQFVEAEAPQYAPDPGQARVVAHRPRRARGVALRRLHGAELHHTDDLVVEAIAILHEEDRSWAVEFDKGGDDDHERQEQEEEERTERLVFEPLRQRVPMA